jgi:hypothetical protein
MFKFLAPLLLILAIDVIAQEPLTGEIVYEHLGVTLTVPEGWVAQEGDGVIFMGNEKVSGLILMTVHESHDMEQMKVNLQAGFSEDGMELFANGTPKELRAGAASMEYTGQIEGKPAKGIGMALLNPYGNGVAIVALALEEVWDPALPGAAMKLMESIRFNKVEYEGPSVDQWKKHLTNVRLTRIESYSSPAAGDAGAGGGYSSRQQIDLCGDKFHITGNSSVYVDGGGNSGHSGGNLSSDGTWSVLESPNGKPVLQLSHSNGERTEYELDMQDSKMYMNGQRWFRTWEGDHAPDCE